MLKVLHGFILSCFMAATVFGQGESLELKFAKKIDTHINAKLKEQDLAPTAAISDAVYLRRVYLDTVGRIPTLKEAQSFLHSSQLNKREVLIEKLQSSPGYVSHNYNYWADALRLFIGPGSNITNTYFSYIKNSLNTNKPYDRFVHEMLASEGSLYDYKNGAANYYMRDKNMPLDNLANTMSLFLGTDMVCAQCHDHPFDRWTQKEYYQLAAFMDGMKTAEKSPKHFKIYKHMKKNFDKPRFVLGRKLLAIVDHKVSHMGSGIIQLPFDYSYEDHKPFEFVRADVPFGPKTELLEQADFPKIRSNGRPTRIGKDINSRQVFADWVISKENPMFTKTIVNRMWDKLMGAPLIGNSLLGIDLKSEGVNKPLTAELIEQMQYLNFDLKRFEKVLMMTSLYQRQGRPVDINHVAKEKNYQQAPIVRRLSAEQVWDSYQTLKSGNIDKDLKYSVNLSSHEYFYELHKNKSLNEVAKLVPKELKVGWAQYFRDLKNAAQKMSLKLAKKKTSSSPSSNTIQIDKPSRKFRASEMRQPMAPGTPLRELGQSSREFIDGKSLEPSSPQAMMLMNKIVSGISEDNKTRLMEDINSAQCNSQKIANAFLAILTRLPTQEEKNDFKNLLKKDSQNGVKHMAWILMNSNEFKFKY